MKSFREYMLGDEEKGIVGRLDEIQMSVEEFALSIGLTRASVYYYLQGKIFPSEQTAHKMAKALGITLEELRELIPTREPGRTAKKQKPTPSIR